MIALITGASSGIGRDIASELCRRGNKVILAGQNIDRLNALKDKLGSNMVLDIIPGDLSKKQECFKLYDKTKKYNIDVLVNNAGFGTFGEFVSTDLDKEIDMINVNVVAVHILTKLFLRDFVKKDSGYILNIASTAAFMAGPLMAAYYSTKNYVLRLIQAIHEELRRRHSNVRIGAFCPGPVNTRFDERAQVSFSVKSISSDFAAKAAVDQIYGKKFVYVPTFWLSVGMKAIKIVPDSIMRVMAYNFQRQKQGRSK